MLAFGAVVVACAVVVVELGAAHSHGNTHMPYSPTNAAQLVASLGRAVCGCWNKTPAPNRGGICGFRAMFRFVVVVALLFQVQGVAH